MKTKDTYDVYDLNDYEYRQESCLPPRDGLRCEEYQLAPYKEPCRLENWPVEDLVSFVGGIYAKEAYRK